MGFDLQPVVPGTLDLYILFFGIIIGGVGLILRRGSGRLVKDAGTILILIGAFCVVQYLAGEGILPEAWRVIRQ